MKLSEYYLENSKNGLSKTFKDSDEGVRIVNMKELFGYNPITDSVEMRQVLLTNSELDRFGLKYNDLLFGRRSLMYEGSGKTTIYKGSLPTVFESSIIRVRLNEEKLNPDFANYYFNSKVGRGNVLSIVTGAAVFGIRGSDLSNLKVKFPILDTQKKIASILSAYDDLIENNNQRITLLEEMAAEIYKEWFVRFRFPGYKEAIFLDKEGKKVAHGTKGAIPEGWENGTIGSLYKVSSGFAFKGSELGDVGVPIIKIRNINNLEVDLINCDRFSGEINQRVEKFLLRSKDLLIAMTGATIGKVSLFPNTSEKYYLNQRVGKFFPHNDSQGISYIYQFVKTRYFKETINNYGMGAAQPNISGEQIESIKSIIPEDKILNKFSSLADSMIDEMLILRDKNQILQETRDLLLPRLISGKLSVEELEIEEMNMAAEPQEKYSK